MDQLTSNLLCMNIDGQQRLPFAAIRIQPTPSNSISYQLQAYTAQRYLPNTTIGQITVQQQQQWQMMEVDDVMDVACAAAAAAAQQPVRRSDRLAAKPTISYKE
jgi:hypothetical protein